MVRDLESKEHEEQVLRIQPKMQAWREGASLPHTKPERAQDFATPASATHNFRNLFLCLLCSQLI